jgi:hypothetical protein
MINPQNNLCHVNEGGDSTGASVPQDHLMSIGLSGLCPAVEKQMISSS